MRRLGHEVEIVNLGAVMPRNPILQQINYRTGYSLSTGAVLACIKRQVGERRFDLAWIDGGHAITPEAVRWIKMHAGQVVNYAIDDPTGPRDPTKWKTFCRALPEYDLCVVMREENVREFRERGAKKILRVMMGHDEVAHARLPYSREDEEKWASDVVFVGTWMPERGPLMAELIRLGVPLAIYGQRWKKAAEWSRIEPNWRGPSAEGQNYVRAIQYAKVAIGLLSKGNRDQHTTRSTEIPFIGSVLCAERTPEHSRMFREGEEAVFWSTPEECAGHCLALLKDPASRQKMAAAGSRRVRELGLANEQVCQSILEASVESLTPSLP